jgi:hypothetical protein
MLNNLSVPYENTNETRFWLRIAFIDIALTCAMLLALKGNGEIDFEEFLMMMAKKMNDVDHEAEIKEAFEIFDREGSGFVTHADLKVCSNIFVQVEDIELYLCYMYAYHSHVQ